MLGIIQARMGSTRLPGKVLRPLGGQEVLAWVIRAARLAGVLDELVVATTDLPEDDAVAEVAAREGATPTRGPVDDVLARFIAALDTVGGGHDVVRLTSDCPLLDPDVIRIAVDTFASGDLDYVGVGPPETLPRGFDVEVVAANALRAAGAAATGTDRSHVTSYVWRQPEHFRVRMLEFAPRADDLRLTLDTEEDWRLIGEVVELMPTWPAAWREVVALLRARPDLVAINRNVRQKSVDEP